jgi:hypothetical protein
MSCCEISRGVVLLRTNVSEKYITSIFREENFSALMMETKFLPHRRFTYGLRDFISCNRATFVTNAVRTSENTTSYIPEHNFYHKPDFVTFFVL